MADDRYYRVSPKFWTRAEQKGWSDDTKLLALYLLTGPHRTTEGLYRLPRKYAQADLEWSAERFAQRLQELVEDGFCRYDDNAQVILITGAMRYQACANENMAKAAVRRLAELPETPLTSDFKQLAERFDERLAERLPEGFGEPQALALAPPQAPSPGESPPNGGHEADETDADDPADDDASPDDAQQTFEQHFWPIYPDTNGRKPEKGKALTQWRKLTVEQRRRAVIGARNLAASDTVPKYAHRFLRKDTAGEFPFDDWQTGSTPTSNGKSPPDPPRRREPEVGSDEWEARQQQLREREEAILGGNA